jgi:hypothetical protein
MLVLLALAMLQVAKLAFELADWVDMAFTPALL